MKCIFPYGWIWKRFSKLSHKKEKNATIVTIKKKRNETVGDSFGEHKNVNETKYQLKFRAFFMYKYKDAFNIVCMVSLMLIVYALQNNNVTHTKIVLNDPYWARHRRLSVICTVSQRCNSCIRLMQMETKWRYEIKSKPNSRKVFLFAAVSVWSY